MTGKAGSEPDGNAAVAWCRRISLDFSFLNTLKYTLRIKKDAVGVLKISQLQRLNEVVHGNSPK